MSSTASADNTSGSRAQTSSRPDVDRLEAEARYHRDRLALYRARVLSAKPTSSGRLQELERTSEAADARLRHAQGGRRIRN
jgi:hypothetical protein